MSQRVSIFRLEPGTQSALAALAKVLGRPMNKLVNEAVRNYLLKISRQEQELESRLASLRAYRDGALAVQEISPPYADLAGVETLAAAREFVRRVKIQYSVMAAILYGSRARGTHRTDSDVDIAIILRGPRGAFMDTSLAMADIAFDLLLETNLHIEPFPIWEAQWDHPETDSNPRLIENIRREGITL
jgi:predicted nucleotidyltransferase